MKSDAGPSASSAPAITGLRPRNLAEAIQLAEIMAKSTMVPKEYIGRPENVLVAIQMGAELGLAPMQALQNVSVINGRPSVWGDAMLALVMARNDVFESIREWIEGEGDNAVAFCEVKRRGQAPHRVRFSMARAKRAKLSGKPGPWQDYPERMLQMRARGFALRDVFPDVLRGLITIEEARDMPIIDADQARDSRDNAILSAISDGFADAKRDAIASPYRVMLPDGTEHVFSTAEQACAALVDAAQSADTIAAIEILEDNHPEMLTWKPGDEPPPHVHAAHTAIREARARLTAPAEAGAASAAATIHARRLADAIKGAKSAGDLDGVIADPQFGALPEKWRNELRARIEAKRTQWDMEEKSALF